MCLKKIAHGRRATPGEWQDELQSGSTILARANENGSIGCGGLRAIRIRGEPIVSRKTMHYPRSVGVVKHPGRLFFGRIHGQHSRRASRIQRVSSLWRAGSRPSAAAKPDDFAYFR
jgi:hypothetical protein